MALNYQKVMNWPFETIEQKVDKKAAILYALGVGFGADPLDEDQLRFVYEGTDGDRLLAAPTMPAVIAYPGFWLKDPETGSDWRKILHGEQGLEVYKPIPVGARVKARPQVDEIIDKGEKGALIYLSRVIKDAETEEPYCRVTSVTFGRGDGGFGGPQKPTPKPQPIPDRTPEHVLDLPTRPDQALIYRLSGDFNPLHADPAVAKSAGFDQPILHGLCTYGVAGHAILKTLCGYDPARLRRLDLRFSAPVFPGETIRTEMWDEGSGAVAFRSRVVERDVVVLNNGRAEIA